MMHKLKILPITIGDEYGVNRFACTVPVRIVVQDQFFARSCNFIFKGQPSHKQDKNMSPGSQHVEKLITYLLMLKIPKALTRSDDIKGIVRELYIFCRAQNILNIHTP